MGALVGSFLNVVIHRLPIIEEAMLAGREAPCSLWAPASRCPAVRSADSPPAQRAGAGLSGVAGAVRRVRGENFRALSSGGDGGHAGGGACRVAIRAGRAGGSGGGVFVDSPLC